jgi:hypothetical protein
MIGYTPERDYQYVVINQRLRAFHAEIIMNVIGQVEALCGRRIPIDPETSLIELNNYLYISIVISRCITTQSGINRWKIRFDTGLHPDVTIAVRMDKYNKSIHDYYILPALEFSHAHIKLSEKNSGFMDSFRADSLDYFLSFGVNIPLDKAVSDGNRNNHIYSR